MSAANAVFNEADCTAPFAALKALICEEWPRQQRPRIIAMTANAMIEDRAMCLAAGMDDYVSKPIRVGELIEALNKCQPIEGTDEVSRSD